MNQNGERKPVAAVGTVTRNGNQRVIVVCDDGSAWLSEPITGVDWQELNPVPGTARERELELLKPQT